MKQHTIFTSAEKDAFRRTIQWQVFRKYIIANRLSTCELCLKPYKDTSKLDVHHKYDTDYTNLDEGRFLVLCRTCHKFVHLKGRTPRFSRMVHLRD